MASTSEYFGASKRQAEEYYGYIELLKNKGRISEDTANQLTLENQERVRQKMLQVGIDAANMRLSLGSGTFEDSIVASLGKVQQGFTTFAAGATESMGTLFKTMVDGFSTAAGHAIVFSENMSQLKDNISNIAKNAMSELIGSFIKLGIQWVINAALGKSIQTTSLATATAASIAAGSATALAWAPAAAMVSLASFGANAAPASVGITAVSALADSIALAGILGFQQGGYTGNGPIDGIAGVVHGKEFVVNADATSRNRATLEAMNKGMSVDSGRSVNMSVTIENHGSNKDFQVQQIDENQVRIIARDVVRSDAPKVVSSQVADANSTVSKSLGRHIQGGGRKRQ